MAKVQAVCIHRDYSFERIEGLYCELTNLATHNVEFFHFGRNLPLEPIFTTGYLAVAIRSALQQSASVDRFCFSRQSFESMCSVVVHPATLTAVHAHVPNWNGVFGLVQNNSIEVIDRSQLRLGSKFTPVSREALFSPGQVYPPLPTVTDQDEVDEIVSYLAWTRDMNPAAFRRFVIVTGEVIPEQNERLRQKGVELHTWGSLTELISTNFFG
ncbi:hypothetical protein JCM8547_001843 [Rhodosporidiobolus lusitaniae]